MQVGFYYKTFIHPKRAWPLYEKILRSAAGLGKIDPDHRRTDRFEKVHRHVDTLVIGGGRAGLEAAVEAAGRDARPRWSTRVVTLGGRLAWSGPDGAEQLARLLAQAQDAGVELIQRAYAGGVYEGRLVPVYDGRSMLRFRPGEVVIATGSIEQPLVFGNNDLPGVMLGGAARRLVNQFRIAPGEEIAIVTSADDGHRGRRRPGQRRADCGRGGRQPPRRPGSAPGRRRDRAPDRLLAGSREGAQERVRRHRPARLGASERSPATCW